MWFRPRAERLFDFHYRIEIYTPEADRKFGYYSLPLLIDDRHRRPGRPQERPRGGVLRVQSAWPSRRRPDETAERLLPVLRRAADWQGLGEVVVAGPRRPLPAIAAALAIAA